MESRLSRHGKCLYCPPHSLPVAGMEPIGGLSPGTCAGGRLGARGGRPAGRLGLTPTPTRPDPIHPGARAWPARSRPQRPGWAASARSKFVPSLRSRACTRGRRSRARVCACGPQGDLETPGVRRDCRFPSPAEDGVEQVARFCHENSQAQGCGSPCRLTYNGNQD